MANNDFEFNEKKMNEEKRMDKRIDINNFNLKHSCQEVFRLEDEIENNLYYNQVWVWCCRCGGRHRLSSGIPFGHPVKPIPVKCESIEDHCWKSVGQKKKFGMDIFEGIENEVGILLTECHVVKCIICDKIGLEELTFITDYNIDISVDQSKELYEYVRLIKDLGFKRINEMQTNKYKGMEIIRIPEFDKKVREIQNINNYIIIN